MQKILDDNSQGVYFQANDAVFDWTVAYLNSVRYYSPEVRLVLLPWDSNLRRLRKLQAEYSFEIFGDISKEAEILRECDEIGKLCYPEEKARLRPLLRRLGVFFGGFSYFIFSDVDICMLSDIDALLNRFRQSKADLCYVAVSEGYVYKPDFLRQMIERYDTKQFNAGFWGSHQGMFSMVDLWNIVRELLMLRSSLGHDGIDQPLINYMFDIREKTRLALWEIDDGMSRSVWPNPNRIGLLRNEGERWFWSQEVADETLANKIVPLLHWAGFRLSKGMPFAEIYCHFRYSRYPTIPRISLKTRDYVIGRISNRAKMIYRESRSLTRRALSSLAWR